MTIKELNQLITDAQHEDDSVSRGATVRLMRLALSSDNRFVQRRGAGALLELGVEVQATGLRG